MLRVLLTADNDLPAGGPRLVGGIQSTATALQAAFGTQAGEWPYDLRFGCQWRREILRKFFDAATTRAALALTANLVPEITPVSGNQIELDTTTNAASRQADITILDVTAGTTTGDYAVSTHL